MSGQMCNRPRWILDQTVADLLQTVNGEHLRPQRMRIEHTNRQTGGKWLYNLQSRLQLYNLNSTRPHSCTYTHVLGDGYKYGQSLQESIELFIGFLHRWRPIQTANRSKSKFMFSIWWCMSDSKTNCFAFLNILSDVRCIFDWRCMHDHVWKPQIDSNRSTAGNCITKVQTETVCVFA